MKFIERDVLRVVTVGTLYRKTCLCKLSCKAVVREGGGGGGGGGGGA